MTLIFVYGTLKRGCRNHHYMAGQTFVGAARTGAGYTLFSLGDYPGMVRAADAANHVDGEVWAVDAAGLTRLDELEGVNEQLYARVPITLEAPFAAQAVETYVYLRNLDGRPAIGAVWRE
jgi:gamma-glutamylcyclotransferase (GGCT)/AIG2-like uncharacterized protein YtfP